MKIKIQPLREARISFFNAPITNVYPLRTMILSELALYIAKSLKPETLALRAIEDVKLKSEFKKANFHVGTFSGSFKKRLDNAIIKHTQLICVDIDNLTEAQLQLVKALVIADVTHTLFCFISPSGNGLKIVYAIDTNLGTQKAWYMAWSHYLALLCGLPTSKIDSSCSNVSRACFLCHDPEVFINPKLLSDDADTTIEIIEIEKPSPEPQSAAQRKPVPFTGTYLNMDQVRYSKPNFENKDWEVNFKYLVCLTIKANGEYQSPREPWIQKLAGLCNQFGMLAEFTLQYVLKFFKNHPESLRADKPIEVETYLIQPVKDAYERYAAQFDTWVNMAVDGEAETPLIDENVYSNLPKVLQKASGFFTGRERDVVLLGTIGVLSTCFPEIMGLYRKMVVGTNLFFFISAPASAGKGVLAFPRLIGEDFHKELAQAYKEEMQAYEEEMQAFKASKSEGTPPVKPRLKKFFIPANSSTIKVIECLNDNKNFGLMFESEADTVFQSLKNDWGNYSDTFRKVFHHEPVELQRKGDDLYIRIEFPCMSAVLSGTPNQMDALKSNYENGFLSRFILYDFPLSPTWDDVFADGNLNLRTEFQQISYDMHSLAEKIRQWWKTEEDRYGHAQILFQLTQQQQDRFQLFYRQKHDDIFQIYGLDPLASIRRLGLISFRLAMLFSVLRIAEAGAAINSELACTDQDLECSLNLVGTLLYHTIKIFNQLKKGGKKRSFKENKANYYDKLPNTFDRGKAMEIARYMEIKEKTAENYVSQYILEEILERLEHNSYQKL
jgi:Protein of unknown function (DUF3987)/VirE N-terminal domain